MNLHRLNIGIIGGGIGVAAAIAFHRAGIAATVYERANELREVGARMMLRLIRTSPGLARYPRRTLIASIHIASIRLTGK